MQRGIGLEPGQAFEQWFQSRGNGLTSLVALVGFSLRAGTFPESPVPMRRWFQNLKVAQKLMLISIFFVLPDSVMFCFFITAINSNIDFAQMEQKGNAYQRPLEQLLELIPQHRRLAALARAGDPSAQAELATKRGQIESAFEELKRVDARIGPALQFTDEGLAKRKRQHYRVQTVEKEWQEFMAELGRMEASASAERYVHLVSDVRTMITHACDMPKLILDPDLDSYYTMDATLLALPETQDRLAAIMAYGEAALAQPAGLTIENRQQVTVYATLLKESDMDRIASSLQTALNEDPNFYGVSTSLQTRLPQAIRDYDSAAAEFVKLTTRVAGTEGTTVSQVNMWPPAWPQGLPALTFGASPMMNLMSCSRCASTPFGTNARSVCWSPIVLCSRPSAL